MPSNPALPEAVREQFDSLLKRAGMGGLGRLVAKSALVAIAPLIIEWARKDQAEKDAQIVEFKIRNYRTMSGPGRADAARDIRAQFATPETTGGTK